MLIHKKSLGILAGIYLGGNVENEVEAFFNRLEDFGIDLDRDEWWEIKGRTKLGIEIKKRYPDFEPVVDGDGNLVGINPVNAFEKIQEQKRTKQEQKEQLAAKHRKRAPVNAVGVFSFVDFDPDQSLAAFAKA